MNGFVDSNGRALLAVPVRGPSNSEPTSVNAWVDTGFPGDLVLPQSTIDSLALDQSGSVDAILADGSQVQLKTYTCLIEWFGKDHNLEVVANSGDYPLLGVGLLLGLELRVNYHTSELSLNAP